MALVVWAALTMERDGAPGAAACRPPARAGHRVPAPRAARRCARVGPAHLACRGAPLLATGAAEPGVVLGLPLVAETHRTLSVLVRQPFQPQSISFTPLTHFAPVIGPDLAGGGPTRLVALVLGAALAVTNCHRRHDLPTVLAVTAVAFSLCRVVLETELNWYYLWPVPALCLLLVARWSTTWFGSCGAALVASIVLGDRRVHHIVLWWPALMATLVVMLLSAGPSPRRWVALVTAPGDRTGAGGPVECDVMVPEAAGISSE